MGKNHASYEIDKGIEGAPIVDEHVMVALYELMQLTGDEKGDLFRVTSGFRNKDNWTKDASSHKHASAIDIGSGNDSKKLMSFFFKNYTVPKGQSKSSFNAHNHTYELTEEGAAFLKKHNVRILDERGRKGAAHWHFDFYNPGFENVDPDRAYGFYEKGKKTKSSTKPGAFNVVVYGNKSKTYKDNGLKETDEYKEIVNILKPDAIDGGKYGTLYNMGEDSNFVKNILPNLGEPRFDENFKGPITEENQKLLRDQVDFFNTLENLQKAEYTLTENEKLELDNKIYDSTLMFNDFLLGKKTGNKDLDNSSYRGIYKNNDDDKNRAIYLNFMEKELGLDNLDSNNPEDLGRKRAILNYLFASTDGQNFARRLEGNEGSVYPLGIGETRLENMFEDSNYTQENIYQYLKTPKLGNVSLDFVKDSGLKLNLGPDNIYDATYGGKDKQQILLEGRRYKSFKEVDVSSLLKQKNSALDKILREQNLIDSRYGLDLATDYANNILGLDLSPPTTEDNVDTNQGIEDDEEIDEVEIESNITDETADELVTTTDKQIPDLSKNKNKTFYPPLKSLTDTPTVSEEDASLLNQANTAVTALKAGAGLVQLGKAMQDIPAGEFPEISQAYQGYAAKMNQLSKTGLTASEKTAIRQDLTDAYQAGVKNVLRASGGNRGLFLANAGVLNANRVEGLLKMGALDAATQRDNLKQYGEVLKIQETFNQKSGILAEQMKYDEAKRKSDLYGTLGSTLIGSAISDIAYATEKGRTSKAEDIFAKLLGSSITSAEIARDAQDDKSFSINFKTDNE